MNSMAYIDAASGLIALATTVSKMGLLTADLCSMIICPDSVRQMASDMLEWGAQMRLASDDLLLMGVGQ